MSGLAISSACARPANNKRARKCLATIASGVPDAGWTRAPGESARGLTLLEVLANPHREKQLVGVVAHDFGLAYPVFSEAQARAATEIHAQIVQFFVDDHGRAAF